MTLGRDYFGAVAGAGSFGEPRDQSVELTSMRRKIGNIETPNIIPAPGLDYSGSGQYAKTYALQLFAFAPTNQT